MSFYFKQNDSKVNETPTSSLSLNALIIIHPLDVFAKLFTDFGSSQNPAATAAKMLQMTSLLASAPDHNEEIERVLSSLKANWKIMMTKGDRRGFAGVRKPRAGASAEASNQIFGTLT